VSETEIDREREREKVSDREREAYRDIATCYRDVA
jgi:hypothetical protein